MSFHFVQSVGVLVKKNPLLSSVSWTIIDKLCFIVTHPQIMQHHINTKAVSSLINIYRMLQQQ